MDNLFSRIPEVICSYNPCLSEKCWEIRDQCVVDLKCRPVFIGIDRRSIPTQCQGECQSNPDLYIFAIVDTSFYSLAKGPDLNGK